MYKDVNVAWKKDYYDIIIYYDDTCPKINIVYDTCPNKHYPSMLMIITS